MLRASEGERGGAGGDSDNDDELYDEAAKLPREVLVRPDYFQEIDDVRRAVEDLEE